MAVAENINKLKSEIPEHVKLVAVSKTVGPEVIMETYKTGHRSFGENRVQELLNKQKALPEDIEWHLIGHLQTNKVKYVVPFIHLIHSVDSLKLLTEINKEASKINRTVPCLLQMHIAREEHKFGLDMEEVKNILSSEELRNFNHVRVTGLMGMATFTHDEKIISNEFSLLKKYFQVIRDQWFFDQPAFREISMGMSGDYHLAIEHGSTIIRVGSLIFGERV